MSRVGRLIGREPALAAASSVVDDARRGAGQFLMISGEAGIGNTVVTLTGTVGWPGGSFFEQAAIAISATVTAAADRLRMLMGEWYPERDVSGLNLRKWRRGCHRERRERRRRAPAARVTYTTATAIVPAAPAHLPTPSARSEGR